MRRLLHFVCLCFIVFHAQAQSNLSHQQQLWITYNNQTQFNKKWGMALDLNIRTGSSYFENMKLGAARIGLNYTITEKLRGMAGYAYFFQPLEEWETKIILHEQRPWEQLLYQHGHDKLQHQHRFRLEQRFRQFSVDGEKVADYLFDLRFRYMYQFIKRLSSTHSFWKHLSLFANDEIMLNVISSDRTKVFDQNRIFLALGFHVNNHDILQAGYLNILQPIGETENFRMGHVIRITYFHNLDLKKKGETQ
jgi:Protein of unknown function (DUF2490)